MTRLIPVDVLKTLGVNKEQYTKMTQREVIELVRWCYAQQASSSNLNKNN